MTRKVILELNKWDDRRYEVEHQTAWGEWRFSASFITRGGGNRRGREGAPQEQQRERQNHRHKGGIMTVSFEGINKGDRIRLTAANGDEATFTVELVYPGAVESIRNVFPGTEWDTLEILPRALPTESGWYEASEFPLSEAGYFPYYLSPEGEWRATPASGGSFLVSEEHMHHVGTLRRLVPEN